MFSERSLYVGGQAAGRVKYMDRQYDKAKMGKIVFGLFAVCAAGYLLLLFFVNQRVIRADVSGCEAGTTEQMEIKIEKIESKYGYLEVRGYAYEPGVSVDIADTQVLAYDPVEDVYYALPTENVRKESLTKQADDGFNYDYAQFRSVTRLSRLPGGCRACIRYRCNGADRLIHTEEVLFY